MSDAAIIEQFRAAIAAAGFTPPEAIEPDKIVRFSTNGKRGDTAGWCKIFPDMRGGVFSDFRSGGLSVWTANGVNTNDEDFRASIEKARRQRDADQEKSHAAAAERAEVIWSAAEPCDAHPYLTRKGVKSYGLRVGRWTKIREDTGEIWLDVPDALLIPVMDGKRMAGLQAVFPAGLQQLRGRDKDFLTGGKKRGCSFPIGKPANPDSTIYVCEGYATGATIHEATGAPVAVAFDAGNLGPVTKRVRAQMPNAKIIIAADNDRWTLTPIENPGVHYASIAAREAAAAVAVPEFADLATKPTDFNDLAALEGMQAVSQRLAMHPEAANDNQSKAGTPAIKDQQIETIDLDKLSEDSLSLIFERRYEHSLRYCHTTGSWFEWTGTRWRREGTGLAFNWAREICRDFGSGNAKFAKAATAGAVERFAQHARCFAVTSEIWDRDHWLIGTPGGTLDLKTGATRLANPGEHITRQAGCEPAQQGARPARWLSFLEDATRGDAGLIRFLQQIAGYALTGDTSEQALFFIYGDGGNGKSVFLNTLAGVLGEYATTAPMDTFSASSHDKHTTDLAMLKGARLVSASETEEGRAWAEARIKTLTGNEPIAARFMRKDNFLYRPEFKLVIVGNHKPRLANVDAAIKRRFKIIPFIHKPSKPDTGLEAALREEWPQIFRWMIDGCLDWQKNGLTPPEVVSAATNEYFDDQDVFGQWLEECTETGPTYIESNAALFASWQKHAEKAGERAGSSQTLAEKIAKRNFQRYRGNTSRGFKGIRLKPPVAQYDPRQPDSWD